MPRPMPVRPALAVAVLLLLTALTPALAQTDEAPSLTIDRWLLLGPLPSPAPAFAEADSDDDEGPGEGVELLAAVDPLDLSDLWPAAGDTVAAPPGVGRHTPRWTEHSAEGAVDLGSGGSDVPRTAVLATYLEVDRFRSLEISARSAHLLRLFVDNREVASKTGVDSLEEEDAEPGTAKATVHLPQGKHLVMVQTVYAPSGPAGWRVEGRIAPVDGGDGGNGGDGGDDEVATLDGVSVTLAREHGLQIGDLLDVASVQGVSISADGRFAAIAYAHPAVPADHRERWVDVHRLDGSGDASRPLLTLPDIGGLDFGPIGGGGARYAYTTSGDAGTEIWVGDLGDRDGSPARRVLGPDESLSGFEWRGDGRSLLLTRSEDDPEESATEKAGLVRRRSLPDRWPNWRDRSHLWEVALAQDDSGAFHRGLMRRITGGGGGGGGEAVSLVAVSPDGAKLLFSTQEIVAERPYLTARLHEVDLSDLSARELGRVDWFNGAAYGPDGRSLLVVGGPSAFGGVASALPEGVIANDYEGEAFLLDLTADDPVASARSLTRELDPSVGGATWTRDGRGIYLQVTSGERSELLRLDPATGATRSIELGFDSVGSLAISENGSRLVAAGSWADRPEQVVALDLESASAEPRLLAFPGRERYDHVTIGAVEEFSFTSPTSAISSEGVEIVGRVHLPPGYDPQAPAGTYPAIVNVYGGVVPVGRSFGGRYPRNLWTAHGYVVLHVQPSGAAGFGQEFAARHVGDWGRINAQEVIEGTRAFLDAYPAVDSERVGMIGASYGGFMTMYTLSATDLFATGIAHAGISSLSSYWGEGWWGYLYSAVASGESLPWNDPDLYVEQSPLFRADQIEAPLLLLHGTTDTNVPPGESEQLYTALELLERDVEFVEIEGQGHHVLDYPKRVLWMETIVAWFDKYLKDQPEWWEHLYPGGE